MVPGANPAPAALPQDRDEAEPLPFCLAVLSFKTACVPLTGGEPGSVLREITA